MDEIPAAHDVEIRGIERGYSRDRGSYYVSLVGGVVDGKSWWMSRSEACGLIQSGEKAFHLTTSDGVQTPVVAEPGRSYWPYLTTPPDRRTDNNLPALPKLHTVPGFRQAILEPDPFG